MKYYKYYVAYSYTSPAVGIGTCEVATGIKMDSVKSINNVRKYVAENYLDGNDCIIMNFIKLKK